MAYTAPLESALAAHRAGRLAEARKLYEQIVQDQPDQVDAWNLLGTLARQENRSLDAVRHISRAIELNPKSSEYHFNLGEALRASAKLEEAIEAYQKSLALRAGDADVHDALGMALDASGRPEEAAECYRRACQLNPSHSDAHQHIAGCLARLGRPQEALPFARRAVALRPNRPEAYLTLGGVLAVAGQWEQSGNAYTRAAQLRPNYADAHAGAATALNRLGRPHNALVACKRAVESDARCTEAYMQAGIALNQIGQPAAAAEQFGQAISIDPQKGRAYAGLAGALAQQLEQEQAISVARRALDLPGCDGTAHSSYLMLLNYAPLENEQAIRVEHEQWAATYAAELAASHVVKDTHHNPLPNPPPEYLGRVITTSPGLSSTRKAPNVPLRVGYVSADFWQHPVSYFIEPVLAGHDRRRVLPFVYSDVSHSDATTSRLRGLVPNWLDTRGLSDADLAEQIRRDGIDILVDLSGHTLGNRLLVFARRPAPVQITWLGYPNTTGLPCDVMQCRLTDGMCDPPRVTEKFHTEALIRLPRTFLCYRPPAEAMEPRLEKRLTGPITFGSFNGLPKITPQVIEVWSRILLCSNGSRLMLKCKGLGEGPVRERVIGEFATCGIDRARLELLPPEPQLRDHLAHYEQIDIALDTFPYNGTTTTCEALWCGTPVVTVAGNVHRSRVGASLLSAVGLDKFVARDIDGYVAAAVELAEQREWLSDLKGGGLRSRMEQSPLRDEAGFVSALETVYLSVFIGGES